MPASREDGQQVAAAVGHIAVDALFILMAEQDAAAPGRLQHPAHPVHHLAAAGFLLPFGNVEGEHAQVPGAQHVRQGQHVIELVQMFGEVLRVDGDLADGRAHGPDGKPGVVQLAPDLPGLVQADVGDVLPVHAADLQPVQAVSEHCGDLSVDLSGSLVGKGVDFHFVQPQKRPHRECASSRKIRQAEDVG